MFELSCVILGSNNKPVAYCINGKICDRLKMIELIRAGYKFNCRVTITGDNIIRVNRGVSRKSFKDLLPAVNDSMLNDKDYNGVSKKSGITYNGVNYIMKENKGGLFAITEYIASRFIKDFGLSCQDVMLSVYNGDITVLIKDFCIETGVVLKPFSDLNQSSVDTDLGDKSYTYEDVLDVVDSIFGLGVDTAVRHHFWGMFLVDTILGNRDRHGGNWGFLKLGGKLEFAPLYDNAGCLFPNIDERISEYRKSKYGFMKNCIVNPKSVIRIDNDTRKRVYKDVLEYYKNDLVLSNIILNTIIVYGEDGIFWLIYDIVKYLPINVIYKNFFIRVVNMRYLVLICEYSYDKAWGITRDLIKGVVLA